MTSVGPRSGSFDEGVLLVFEETRVCEREGDDPDCAGRLALGRERVEADWKRQVVVNDLKSGVEEDATAYQV